MSGLLTQATVSIGGLPGAVDLVLVDLISTASAAVARGDAAAVCLAARAAVQRARDRGAGPLLLGEACLYDAIGCNLLYDYAAAYERALEAVALLADGAHSLRVRALMACFIACAETGSLSRALGHSQRAMDIAQAGGDPEALARVLHNRGCLFQRLGEHEEAVHLLGQAVELSQALPPRRSFVLSTRINLAAIHMEHARALAARGQAEPAARQRQRAAEVLPAMELDPQAPAQPHELGGLHTWVAVQAELGRLSEARRGLRRYLRLVRRAGGARRYRDNALCALALYHFHSGRIGLAIVLQGVRIERLHETGSRFEAVEDQERLADMHATCGQHAQALAWRRAAHRERLQLRAQHSRVWYRLSALERELEHRHAAAREQQVHAQRLAVVGRLMSDIHHALALPIAQVHHTLAQDIERAPPQAMAGTLARVIDQMDNASGLARQLKMFSYRAAPQPMVVNLQDALREACDGVALHRPGSPRGLAVHGEAQAQVRVDAQRLAVLLRILLIEAERVAAAATPAAHFSRVGACMRMELEWGLTGRQPTWTGSVGLTLCREIAQEVGGRLEVVVAPVQARCVLELPLP